jgi:hypothetical protein
MLVELLNIGPESEQGRKSLSLKVKESCSLNWRYAVAEISTAAVTWSSTWV